MGRVPTQRKSARRGVKRTVTKIARVLGKAVKRRSIRRRKHRPKLVMYNKLLQHKVRTAMVYADTKTITPGAKRGVHVFKMNSIFDPDYTGGGHQPAFHDRWALLYKHYRVLRCSFHITYTPHREHIHALIASSGTATGELHGVIDTNHNDMVRNPGILF